MGDVVYGALTGTRDQASLEQLFAQDAHGTPWLSVALPF